MNSAEPHSIVRRGYHLLVRAASSLQSPFLLLIRLYWGWSFFVSGKAKLQDHEKFVKVFTDLHVPLASLSVWLAASAECFGGLLLMAGLASRLTALPLIFTMIVAYVAGDLESFTSIFSDPDKFTGATPFLFLYASVIVLIFGPGAFSIDWLLSRTSSAYRPPHRSMFL